MAKRHNFYGTIHKAIRVLMLDLVRKSGRLDFTDARAVAEFRGEVAQAFDLLESHAEHENTFIGPVVEQHAPELSHHVAPTHEEQEHEIDELAAMLEAIDPRAADAPVHGHAFVVALSRFFGDLMMHMADEEEQIMPALQAVMTDAELIAVEERIVASIPPEKMVQYLSIMIPAINTPERIELLDGARATAPPEVYGMMRNLASSVLSAEDDGALALGLGELAA